MKKITVSKAIGEALHEEMLRDKNVFIMGEDMAVMGNVFAITKGFLEEFGPNRVIDTPISEEGFVGMAVGAAMRGLRPVAAVAPGVAAATGLSLQQLAAALVGQLRPAAVVCVDSLCSAEGQRLGRTVQFSDSGLYPAQADHTRHLTRDTVGVPVVAAGIPTLMQAQEGADLVVTPRALDSVIAHGAALLACAVNRALQPRLTVQQLCWLTG